MPAEVLIHCIAGAVSPLDEDEGLVLEHINIRTGGKLGPHLLRPVAEELIGKDLGDHQDQLLLRQRDYLHPLHHNGLEADDQIHPAMGQLVLQVGGVTLKQGKFHHGELRLKFRQYVRQQGQAAGMGDPQAQQAHVMPVDVPYLGQILAV